MGGCVGCVAGWVGWVGVVVPPDACCLVVSGALVDSSSFAVVLAEDPSAFCVVPSDSLAEAISSVDIGRSSVASSLVDPDAWAVWLLDSSALLDPTVTRLVPSSAAVVRITATVSLAAFDALITTSSDPAAVATVTVSPF